MCVEQRGGRDGRLGEKTERNGSGRSRSSGEHACCKSRRDAREKVANFEHPSALYFVMLFVGQGTRKVVLAFAKRFEMS